MYINLQYLDVKQHSVVVGVFLYRIGLLFGAMAEEVGL